MTIRAVEFIAAGHVCLDVIPTFEGGDREPRELLVPGKLVNVGKAILATGGSVANTGVALRRLGLATRLMGKVGDDKFGETIIEILQQTAPELVRGMIVDASQDTSYSIVLSPPGVDRIFFHNPGANNSFSGADVEDGRLVGARYFHFGYPPLMRSTYCDGGKDFAAMMRRIKRLGLTTSLDMAYPDPDSEAGRTDWRAWLEQVLPFIDIFLPSLNELHFMLAQSDFEASSAAAAPSVDVDLPHRLAAELVDMGAAVVVLKLGDQGLYMKTSDDPARLANTGQGGPASPEEWLGVDLYNPCFECTVRGTTGAGDCTIAGFLAGLSKGLSPRDAAITAVAVGGFSVESPDATSGIPHWDRVIERIESGWKIREGTLSWPG